MIKKIFPLLMVIAAVTGCKKDPSSAVLPTNVYLSSNYPANLDQLNSVLATCYSNLRDPNLFGFNFLPKVLSNCTHAANSAYNDNGGWHEMANTNLQVSNSYVQGAWAVLYAGVKNCNTTLQGADTYEKTYAPNPRPQGDVDAVNWARGQAYFLRAYYYFQLESLFGEDNVPNASGTDTMGVPIVTAKDTAFIATQRTRSSIKSVWALIESDLTRAASLLQGKVWTGNDEGRVSEWAAKGLLGKAYVFTKDYPKARTTLLDVITNSGRSLMPYAKYRDAFIGLTANEYNEESLFELNIDFNAQGNYGVYGNAPNSTSINGLIWSPWVLGNDGTENSSNSLGYGNEVIHDQNILRFGYKLGGYNLVANPAFNNGKPASALNPQKVMDLTYRQQALDARTNKTADPRLYVNMLQPWIDSAINIPSDGYFPVSKPAFFAGQFDKYGWSFRKYAPIFSNVNNVTGGQADGANLYLLRLADVYLLYAEACINSSDGVTGLEYLNKVKRRAYGYPVNGSSPVDYASLTASTSAANTVYPDPVLGNNPLYYERWAELFNEGHWWYDVCRWHLGKSEAAYFVTAMNADNPIVFPDKTYAWPIPLAEINANSKIANQQNPGYQ
jgi:hypothetical protein